MATQFKPTSGYAPSGDGKIYFETAGSGRALVFIHAGVSDRRMWDPQFETFARDFQVIRFDLRGFGKSAIPPGPYSNRDDLRSVLAFLGVAKAALVGCSMGGTTAIDFALEHPEAASALVPVGAGVSGSKDWSPQTIKHFGEMMRLVQDRDLEGARERDARFWINGPARDSSKIDSAYRDRATQLHRENFSIERFAMPPEQELVPPAIGRLGEIRCPTMVVVGDSDADDLLKLSHRLASDIPGARHVTIENAAHLPSLEHPDQFNAILRDFLVALPK